MSSHIVFLAALQAWRIAGGKDFVSPRPNAQWLANRWLFLSLAKDGKATFQPQRGGYPHNIWARHDISGAGYFSYARGITADRGELVLRAIVADDIVPPPTGGSIEAGDLMPSPGRSQRVATVAQGRRFGRGLLHR